MYHSKKLHLAQAQPYGKTLITVHKISVYFYLCICVSYSDITLGMSAVLPQNLYNCVNLSFVFMYLCICKFVYPTQISHLARAEPYDKTLITVHKILCIYICRYMYLRICVSHSDIILGTSTALQCLTVICDILNIVIVMSLHCGCLRQHCFRCDYFGHCRCDDHHSKWRCQGRQWWCQVVTRWQLVSV